MQFLKRINTGIMHGMNWNNRMNCSDVSITALTSRLSIMANPEILGSLEGGSCSKLNYMNHCEGIMVNRRMERRSYRGLFGR